MFSEEYIAIVAVLDDISFLERGDFGHRIIGTSYIFVPMNCKPGEVEGFWYFGIDRTLHRISFEEVWDGVDNDIRGEMVFHLDLFK
jgi:hypothetical protein